jgi:glyoxylase I family protein
MKFYHTALSVRSIKESQRFYEDIFAFTFRRQGERPELGVKFVILEDSSGHIIEFFEHQTPITLKEDLMDFSKIGYKHIAFVVDNIERTIKKAQKYGVKIIWPIKKGITVKRIAFISDPNGLPIELVEL